MSNDEDTFGSLVKGAVISIAEGWIIFIFNVMMGMLVLGVLFVLGVWALLHFGG
jgi:hypothetical protein